MTMTRSATVDPAAEVLGSSDRAMRGSAAREAEDRGAHLLRLVLDLQLDALLLGLGAAAVEASRSPVPVPAQPPAASGGAPWPRWSAEDIDLVRTLAAETVQSGAALPATLGPDPGGQEEHVVLRRLAARYESMRDLLADLLARADRGGMAPGQRHLLDLMAHCENRLVELSGLTRQSPGTPARGHRSERAYLPGELLG